MNFLESSSGPAFLITQDLTVIGMNRQAKVYFDETALIGNMSGHELRLAAGKLEFWKPEIREFSAVIVASPGKEIEFKPLEVWSRDSSGDIKCIEALKNVPQNPLIGQHSTTTFKLKRALYTAAQKNVTNMPFLHIRDMGIEQTNGQRLFYVEVKNIWLVTTGLNDAFDHWLKKPRKRENEIRGHWESMCKAVQITQCGTLLAHTDVLKFAGDLATNGASKLTCTDGLCLTETGSSAFKTLMDWMVRVNQFRVFTGFPNVR